ncbi:MAG TPA: glucose 1-dehydrogenase [Vicinamibacterales bacterium]|jgi:glucose 1-dehydrogenase|nr:glucose 1-dehydrogenase [Vicinamibacterales bacterium]
MDTMTMAPQAAAGTGRLLGRKALVTGSSKGIGYGIALRLAREGADVVVNYNSDPRGADEALSQIQALGRRGASIKANLGDVADVQRLVAESVAALDGLDVLVNNAGIEKHAAFVDVTEHDFDAVLDVNLKGVFFATQAFVRRCVAAGRPGKIVNVSSVHEEMAFPNFAAYCASKGGVRMLTRTLAVELGPLGITINSIAPGAIDTPINSALLHDPVKLQSLVGQIPLARLGKPADVSSLAVFLASSDSDYVTGSTYFVDGGLSVFYQEQ